MRQSNIVLWVIGLLFLIVAYVAFFVGMTRYSDMIPKRTHAAAALSDATAPITVMTWNIGYGGLGAASDFILDGGEMLRAPSRATVEDNLAGIRATLDTVDTDFILMQEAAGPGLLNRGVDVLRGVRTALPTYSMYFTSDIHTLFAPPPISLTNGLAMFNRIELTDQKFARLTEEPTASFGVIKRRYHTQVARFEAEGTKWTVFNVHLSAFDEGADTRMQQLREVMALAETEYSAGRGVILGGDWNMRLRQSEFPYTTAKEDLFWVHDFPEDALPDGFTIVTDPKTPTSRSNEKPFVDGENFRSIIDGFIISPNVGVKDVAGLDLGFRHTDHQPVKASFVFRAD